MDAAALQEHLDAEPTGRSRVEHSRAMASLPDADAKAWAWQRFTGEVAAPNYELQAAGLAMWRTGQEHLTAPYVERYFAELPAAPRVHSGWVLGDVTEAFFPTTALTRGDAGRGRAGHRRAGAGPDHPPEPGRPDRRAAPRLAIRRRYG